MQDPNEPNWDAFAPETPGDGESGSRRRIAFGVPEWIVIGVGILTIVGLFLLWPDSAAIDQAREDLEVLGIPSEFHEATVTDTQVFSCGEDFECLLVTFEIGTGPDSGLIYTQEFPIGSTTPDFEVGETVVLSRIPPSGSITALDTAPCDFDSESECTVATVATVEGDTFEIQLFPGQEQGLFVGADVHVSYDSGGEVIAISPASVQTSYQFSDMQRRSFLFVLILVFAAAVIALGRWRGVAALTGIGLSIAVVVIWLIPSLLSGNSAILVALIGATAIAYLALYLSHGIRRTTTVALLGTIAALALTTFLSGVTVSLAQFTGFASEEATLLSLLEGIDVRSILLAGFVIGAAGALDDVTVTQSAAINQLRRANPEMSVIELFKAGMEIGKAHVGSIVNTLVLAYLGAALPLAILVSVSEQSLGAISNSEIVAVEITRAIVGTLGIIAAVPLTTWFATLWPASSDEIHSH